MKVLGLIFVIAIVVMGYCVYNPMVVDSADSTNTKTQSSSTDNCKGPFGVDSQKILNKGGGSPDYKIGVVSNIDLEKNPDGTWYVSECKLSNALGVVFFKPPYPQRNDLKDGDIIGFSGSINELRGSYYYTDGKILDYISSQSVNCKIDAIKGLSTPAKDGERFGSVTGVIIAVEIAPNRDPEPDNPDDFQITEVVMKCADGNLYIVNFLDESDFVTHALGTFKDELEEGYFVLLGANLPSHEAFGEGDVVTLEQVSSVVDLADLADATDLINSLKADDKEFIPPNYLSFHACYKKDVKGSNGRQ